MKKFSVTQCVSERLAAGGAQKAGVGSPAFVWCLAPLDVVVVVTMVDHFALVVEAQHGHPGEGQFLPLLPPAAPPFDCCAVARNDRLAEPALDVLLGPKVLAQIAPNASQAGVGLTECRRAIYGLVGVERCNGFRVTLRPGPRPGVCPTVGGGFGIHAVIQAERLPPAVARMAAHRVRPDASCSLSQSAIKGRYL